MSAAVSHRRTLIERSVTLLRAFLLASGLVLLAVALVLGSILTSTLKQQTIDSRRAELTRFVASVVGPQVVHGGRVAITRHTSALLDAEVRNAHTLLSVKVWRADGTLAWTNVGRSRIGRRFEIDSELSTALATDHTAGSIARLDAEENAIEKQLVGDRQVLQVYAPIDVPGRARPIGAYEIYSDPSHLESVIASTRTTIWLAVGAAFAALWLILALLVRGASRLLRGQTTTLRQRSLELLDAYRRQEELSLEAIESLNATVEAKDPYTAGHSARVAEIAVAVGTELGLTNERLDALRYGALFHDIGKLAVPDAILTKPDSLTDEEYELIKRHSDEGGRIVGKFGRLRPAVPVIRHHHERWAGGGYPDGLAGTQIPLEAAIVGLADAWDAMTTDRPYHRALTFDEAAAQLRDGRGSQFVPEVVDAFFHVLRRRRFEVPSAPSAPLQAAS